MKYEALEGHSFHFPWHIIWYIWTEIPFSFLPAISLEAERSSAVFLFIQREWEGGRQSLICVIDEHTVTMNMQTEALMTENEI